MIWNSREIWNPHVESGDMENHVHGKTLKRHRKSFSKTSFSRKSKNYFQENQYMENHLVIRISHKQNQF